MIIIKKAGKWPTPDKDTYQEILTYLLSVEDCYVPAGTRIFCKSWSLESWGDQFKIITKDKKHETYLALRFKK